MIFFLTLVSCGKKAKVETYSIIPEPVSIECSQHYFKYTPSTKICLDGLGRNSNLADYLTQTLREFHFKPRFTGTSTSNSLVLRLLPASAMSHPDEYSLHIGDSGICIASVSEKGLFYGLQTFLQMLPEDINKVRYNAVSLPYCSIVDYPRYQWRAFRIDAVDNNFPISELKRYVSIMSFYKLNRLHMRLDGIGDDDDDNRYSYTELCDLEYFAKQNYVELVLECDSCDDESLVELSTVRSVEADKLISTSETSLRRGYRFDPLIEVEEGGGLFEIDSVSSTAEFEYRMLPAICAFAECVWTPSSAKHWPEFRRRIESHKLRLENMEYSYHMGSFEPVVRWLCSADGSWQALLECEVYGAKIHYTVDGLEPTLSSPVVHGPVSVPDGAQLKTLVEYRDLIRGSVCTFSH
ncbi:MAG: family 20 glycosylhydrolase [Bacteroidales bacterium]|nr:family 20 glycosylhydrolase [Bacteroidales bacterium]